MIAQHSAANSSWICDSTRPDPGDGCVQSSGSPDGITRFASKRDCESNCLHSANFKTLAEAIKVSGIKYPFADELWQLASEHGEGAISEEFRAAMKAGAGGLVAELFDSRLVAKYYSSIPNVNQLPRLYLNFAMITSDNMHLYDHFCDGLSSDDNLYVSRFCVNVAKAKLKLSDNPDSEIYILMQDQYQVDRSASKQYQKHGNWRVHEYLDESINLGRQTIIPVHLDGIDGAHANALYISHDGGKGTAILLEPHVAADWSRAVDEAIPQIFSNLFEKFNIKYTSLASIASCRRGFQSSMFHDYGSCQTWEGLMASIYALNPHKNQKHLLEQALSTGKNSAILLDLFVFHVYRRTIAGEFGDYGRLREKNAEAMDSVRDTLDRARARAKDATAKAALDAIKLRDTWFWVKNGGEHIRQFIYAIEDGNDEEAIRILRRQMGKLKWLMDVGAWMSGALAAGFLVAHESLDYLARMSAV